jgi:hypothetical protein
VAIIENISHPEEYVPKTTLVTVIYDIVNNKKIISFKDKQSEQFVMETKNLGITKGTDVVGTAVIIDTKKKYFTFLFTIYFSQVYNIISSLSMIHDTFYPAFF